MRSPKYWILRLRWELWCYFYEKPFGDFLRALLDDYVSPSDEQLHWLDDRDGFA